MTDSGVLQACPPYSYSDFRAFSEHEADEVLSVHADPIHRLAAVATATLDFSVELLQQARTPEPIDVGRFVADFAGLDAYSARRQELFAAVSPEWKCRKTIGLTFGQFPTAANAGDPHKSSRRVKIASGGGLCSSWWTMLGIVLNRGRTHA